MTFPSLRRMCLETLAEIKHANPEVDIPFDNIPSNLINELFGIVIEISKNHRILLFNNNNSKKIEIIVPYNMTVKQIRAMASELFYPKYEVQIGRPGLISAGHRLEDNKTLGEYGIPLGRVRNWTIYVTVK